MEAKQKLKKLLVFKENKDLATFDELQEINESLKVIAEKEIPPMPEMPKTEFPEVQKIKIEGVEILTIKGEKGDIGDTPKVGIDFEQPKDGKNYVLTEQDKKEIAQKIEVPIVERIVETIIEKQPIITNEIKEVSVYESSDAIIEKINQSEEQIDKERISGLEDEIKELRKEITTSRGGGGVRRVFQPYIDDFSSQTNGSTKIFYLSREPLRTNTVQIFGTDFPTILRPTTDFTISGKTLTLTSAVPAPNSGATLLAHYFA